MKSLWNDAEAAGFTGPLGPRVYSSRLLGRDKTLLLHAILPHAYVDHTHADAVLAVSNAPQGVQRVREIYGSRVVVIPYLMPGFELAAYCAREFARQASEETIGMVLLS